MNSSLPPDMAEWGLEWKNFLTRLCTTQDLTGAEEDYYLAIGETAKVNITSASTPLHVACENGVYEINIIFDKTTFAADSGCGLQVNNQDFVGEFIRGLLRGATDIATDEVDMSDAAADRHWQGTSTRLMQLKGTVTIMDGFSAASAHVFGIDTTTNVENIIVLSTYWAGTHYSLGTILLSEDATGVCYLRRTA
jgi:hypothetical protein